MNQEPVSGPVMSYYGSKWMLSRKYPKHIHGKIIEPFAGSACYALQYPWLNVDLYDLNPIVCGVWEYLIKARESDILSLPLLEPGQRVSDLGISQEAKWLIGFWTAGAICAPQDSATSWATSSSSANFWGIKCRARIASNVHKFKHWRIFNKSYHDVENERATWFIDPPYQDKGKRYTCSSKDIDFRHLGDWCKSRSGLSIVCENSGADWLPFEPFEIIRGAYRRRQSQEVVWIHRTGLRGTP